MEFKGMLARWLRPLGAAGCAALVTLSGCGGGDPIEKFQPTRIVSFGDEASLIVQPSTTTPAIDGKKYTINTFEVDSNGATLTTLDCRRNPLWIQSVAGVFGLRFKACPNSAVSNGSAGDTGATGLIYATPKAKVADFKTQIDNFLATETPFSHSDVVTVMVGMYDVLEQYSLSPATPESTLIDNVKQRGKDLATQINRIAITGAPVIVMRIPSVGITPYGQQQSDKGALLGRLTKAFNTEMQLNIINDGHLIGLVYADADIEFVAANYAAYGLANATEPACKAAAAATDKLDDSVLLSCVNTADAINGLVTAAGTSSSTYLWAGNLQLSPYGHSRLGSIAASRAISNPF